MYLEIKYNVFIKVNEIQKEDCSVSDINFLINLRELLLNRKTGGGVIKYMKITSFNLYSEKKFRNMDIDSIITVYYEFLSMINQKLGL